MLIKNDKAYRLLQINEWLSKGETLNKVNTLVKFDIPAKTFQRDIASLRSYYLDHGVGNLIYDRNNDCYLLDAMPNNLSKEEVFAVCKVLTESRAFNKQEFNEIIKKLLKQCNLIEGKSVKNIIANEQVNYIQLQHGKPLVKVLWQLAECISEQKIIKFIYKRTDDSIRRHEVKPVGILFSEFYFYLLAYLADDSKMFPTVFRVDRIGELKLTEEIFAVPYAKRFSESEFRKKVQFMYSGELRIIRFLYRGVLESLLDRVPSAQIEKNTDDGVVIRAEVYGEGLDIWLRSQGVKVEVL